MDQAGTQFQACLKKLIAFKIFLFIEPLIIFNLIEKNPADIIY